MNSRTPLIYLTVVIAALIGGFFIYDGFLKEPDAGEPNTDDTTPSGEEQSPSEFTPPTEEEWPKNMTGDIPMRPDGFNDTLGISSVFRDLLTGISTIAEEKGTSEDVLVLVTELEEKLNDTIEGQELDEEQTAFVENLTNMLTEVREMAEEGASPAAILDKVRPQRRPS